MRPSRACAKKASSSSLRLKLLSQTLEVRADQSELLRVLRFQFRHFLSPSRGQWPDHRVILRLKGSRPGLTVNGVHRAIPRAALGLRHGMSLLLEAILDTVQSHLLFHAGVVSHADRGMLISGPPGFGKTSIVLEIVRRGFGFLSDDYAPVALDSGLVLPFPRSLGIVASTRKAVSWPREVPRSKRILFDGKWLIDPSGFPGLRLAGPCRPEVVLLLGPEGEAQGGASARYEVSVIPERVEELRDLFPEFRLRMRPSPGATPGSTFRFRLPEGKDFSGRLEKWAYANRPAVLSLTRLFSPAGKFRPPLKVHRVPPREGLIEVLGDLQNRRPLPKNPLAPGTASPALLLLQAASLLGRSDFYRFEGGSLTARADAAASILTGGAGIV